MASSTWSASIEDTFGNVLSFASTIQAVSLTVPLNGPAEVSTAFDLDGPDAKAILDLIDNNYTGNGIPCLRLMENGTARFFGLLSDVQADVGDDSSLTARFVDAAGQLANIFTYTVVSGSKYRARRYPRSGTTSTTSIVSSLVGTGSPLVPLTVSGTVSTARAISPEGGSVLDALTQMSDANYLEWYVTPTATLNIAASVGDVNKYEDVVFHTDKGGISNVLSASVQYRPPVNRVFVQADNQEVSEGASDSASITTYGEFAESQQVQTSSLADAADAAVTALRAEWRQVAEVTLEPSTCPRPWTDWFLGDTVFLSLQREGLSLVSAQRVNQFVVNLDDSLVESEIVVTFEIVE